MTDAVPLRSVPADDFTIGDWLCEPSLDRVSRGDCTVHLRPQLTDLLVVLARSAGRTVPKHVILDEVWGSRFVGESALTRCIAEIRQALGDNARQPAILETIPKRGYRLVAPVVFLPPGASASPVPPPLEPVADTADPVVEEAAAFAVARSMKTVHFLRDLHWKVLLVLAAAVAITLASGRCRARPVETRHDAPVQSRAAVPAGDTRGPAAITLRSASFVSDRAETESSRRTD